MKRMLPLLVITALITITAQATAPYFAFRSQSVNAVRELVGEQTLINRADMDNFYSVFSITPEFTRTFWPGKIAYSIFGSDVSCNDCKATINIQGSLTSDGAPNMSRGHAWLADYFGLSRDYAGTLVFEPQIWNFNIDLNYYLGLDEWAKGLYFRIHAPITYTKWNLGFCENCGCDEAGTYGYDEGYFAPRAVPAENLYQTAANFFTGDCNTPDLGRNTTDSANIIFEPLKYSKFSTCCDGVGKCRLSDIEMALGWNFYLDPDYHLGAEIRASAPTGNKPTAEYLFSPVVGSGGNWKLGVGLTGHAIIHRWCDDERSLGFWVTAYIQHLFDACQDRVFDLHCKPNSRYMIAEKMDKNTEGLIGGLAGGFISSDPSIYQFADHFAPVANLTHRCVNVNVPVEGDVVAKFTYSHCNFEWDLGYEFWGRSCEQICKRDSCCDRLANETWALKGDAHVYGYHAGRAPEGWYPLAPSEHKATIYSGTDFMSTFTVNTNIDFPQLAFIGFADRGNEIYATEEATTQIDTSIQTVVLTDGNIGYEDAQTKSLSHKVFTHFGYIWKDDACKVLPFLGVGASAEFSPSCCTKPCKTSCNDGNSCCTKSDCGTACSSNTCCDLCCQQGGISQWAVWLKGGFTW